MQEEKEEEVLATELAGALLRQMLQREGADPLGPEYMEKQADLNCKMRAILTDWLIDVHKKYQQRRETVFLAVSLVDRYLSCSKVSRGQLQLVGATALLIAAKFEEVEPLEMGDLVYVADSAYSKADLLTMEGSMLRALDFKISAPTAANFLRHYQSAHLKLTAATLTFDPLHPEYAEKEQLKAQKESQEGQTLEAGSELAWCLMELSLLELDMLRHRPSLVAAAALFLSNRLFGRQPPWPQRLQQLSGYAVEDLEACSGGLWRLLQSAQDSELPGIRQRLSAAHGGGSGSGNGGRSAVAGGA